MSNSVIMIGLPDSGKSTFLAALNHQLKANEISTELGLARLGSDSTYIDKLTSQWLTCGKIDHTTGSLKESVDFELQRPDESTLKLNLPDISGEEYVGQWARREVSPEYRAFAQGVNGAMFFIHPKKVRKSIRIETARTIAGPNKKQEKKAEEKAKPFDAEKTVGSQVIFVDLLQVLLGETNIRPLQLTIVISAWDSISPAAKQTWEPNEWVKTTLPFFYQFVTNNSLFETEFWGVSGQGGDYPKTRDELLDHDMPSTRPKLFRGGKSHVAHDLTSVIAHLLG